MKKTHIIVGTVVLLTIISIVMFVNHLFFSSSWKKIASFKDRELNEQYLCSFSFDINGHNDTITTIYKDKNNVLFYKGFDNNELIQVIKLEGELIDYFYIYNHKLFYFTIRAKGVNKIVIYKLNNKFEYIGSYNTDCTRCEDDYSGYNYQNSSDIIALRSEDRCKVQLFKPPFKIVYEYKHKRPFVIAKTGYNVVFDGDSFFDIYKPNNILRNMNYNAVQFNSSMLDLNKPLMIHDTWLYNNNYLLCFDVNLNVKSITKHEDLFRIIPKDSNNTSCLDSYYCINRYGFSEFIGNKTIEIIRADNVQYKGLILEEVEMFTTNNNGKISMYTYVIDPFTEKSIIQELESIDGKLLDVWQEKCVLYILTSDGVYCMGYPYKPIKTYNID